MNAHSLEGTKRGNALVAKDWMIEEKNIHDMVYEVILLGESHNTENKKNNPNSNPQSFNDCVCSIYITDWPDDMAVRYLYLFTGR